MDLEDECEQLSIYRHNDYDLLFYFSLVYLF